MREKRVGLVVGALGGAAVGDELLSSADCATGEKTVSPVERSDVCNSSSGLCFCNSAVGGMSVTCLKNVAMAR
jgi:hypothetical protein